MGGDDLFHAFRLQRQPGQRLTELIVQFPRNALTLAFLGIDQPLEQLLLPQCLLAQALREGGVFNFLRFDLLYHPVEIGFELTDLIVAVVSQLQAAFSPAKPSQGSSNLFQRADDQPGHDQVDYQNDDYDGRKGPDQILPQVGVQRSLERRDVNIGQQQADQGLPRSSSRWVIRSWRSAILWTSGFPNGEKART